MKLKNIQTPAKQPVAQNVAIPPVLRYQPADSNNATGHFAPLLDAQNSISINQAIDRLVDRERGQLSAIPLNHGSLIPRSAKILYINNQANASSPIQPSLPVQKIYHHDTNTFNFYYERKIFTTGFNDLNGGAGVNGLAGVIKLFVPHASTQVLHRYFLNGTEQALVLFNEAGVDYFIFDLPINKWYDIIFFPTGHFHVVQI